MEFIFVPMCPKVIVPAASLDPVWPSERPKSLILISKRVSLLVINPRISNWGGQVGATTFLVRTGYGADFADDPTVNPDYVADDLSVAAQTIQGLLEANERRVDP